MFDASWLKLEVARLSWLQVWNMWKLFPPKWKTSILLSKFLLLFLQMKMFNHHPGLNHVLILHLFWGMYCVNSALKINWVVVCNLFITLKVVPQVFLALCKSLRTMHFLPIWYGIYKIVYHNIYYSLFNTVFCHKPTFITNAANKAEMYYLPASVLFIQRLDGSIFMTMLHLSSISYPSSLVCSQKLNIMFMNKCLH